eukprot:PhM_4_TR11685/c0_g1_i1/m.76245
MTSTLPFLHDKMIIHEMSTQMHIFSPNSLNVHQGTSIYTQSSQSSARRDMAPRRRHRRHHGLARSPRNTKDTPTSRTPMPTPNPWVGKHRFPPPKSRDIDVTRLVRKPQHPIQPPPVGALVGRRIALRFRRDGRKDRWRGSILRVMHDGRLIVQYDQFSEPMAYPPPPHVQVLRFHCSNVSATAVLRPTLQLLRGTA